MALNRSINRFNEGVWSEQLHGRWDLDGYENALTKSNNVIPRKYGPAARRQGTEYIDSISGVSNAITRSITFNSEIGSNYILNFQTRLSAFFLQNGWAFVWKTNPSEKVTLDVGDTSAWVTATGYVRGDYVNNGGTVYRCDNDHTSGVFATDLSNGQWVADNHLALYTPFGTDSIQDNEDSIHYAQINDVMYICQRNNPVQKVSRFSEKSWTWEEAGWAFPPMLTANTDTSHTMTLTNTTGTGLTLTSSQNYFTNNMVGGHFALTRTRPANEAELDLSAATGNTASFTVGGEWTLVTSGVWDGTVELRRSTDGFANYDVVTKVKSTIAGGANDQNYTVTGSEDDPLAEYRIYFTLGAAGTAPTYARVFSPSNKVEGFVKITAFTDAQNVTVDVEQDFEPTAAGAWVTSEWREGAFSVERGYPSDVTFFEGRLILGGTSYRKQGLWMSKTDSFEDFGRDVNNQRATDSLFYLLSSQENNRIQWIRGKKYLLIGTEGEIFSMRGSDGFALSPNVAPLVTVEASVGSEYVMPVIVEDRVIFVRRGGTEVHAINFDSNVDGFGSEHLNKLFEIDLPDGQSNLFTGDRIQELAEVGNPDNILFIRGNRDVWDNLWACVISEEDGVNAWWEVHAGGTGDAFHGITSTTNKYGDVLWLMASRQNGLFMEEFSPKNPKDPDNDNYLDSVYIDTTPPASGVLPNNTIDWLEGESVLVNVDGQNKGPFTVATGAVDYGVLNASSITVGLPVTWELQTLPLEAPAGDGASRGKVKSMDRATVGFSKSRGDVEAKVVFTYENGEEEQITVPIDFRQTWHNVDEAVPVFTGQKHIEMPRRRDASLVRICLTGSDCQPINITYIIPRISPHGQ